MARPPAIGDLAEELGISMRQLDFWCSKGYIRATTNGAGDPRSIPDSERRILAAMARLVLAGIPAELSSRIARKACETAGHASSARIRISRKDKDPGITIEMHGL